MDRLGMIAEQLIEAHEQTHGLTMSDERMVDVTVFLRGLLEIVDLHAESQVRALGKREQERLP